MSVAEAAAPAGAVRSRVWTDAMAARVALGVIALHVVDRESTRSGGRE